MNWHNVAILWVCGFGFVALMGYLAYTMPDSKSPKWLLIISHIATALGWVLTTLLVGGAI